MALKIEGCLTQLYFRYHEACEIGCGENLRFAPRVLCVVDCAKCANHLAGKKHQRNSEICGNAQRFDGRHLRVHRIGACVRNNQGALTLNSEMAKGLSRELSLGSQRFPKAAVAQIKVPVIVD